MYVIAIDLRRAPCLVHQYCICIENVAVTWLPDLIDFPVFLNPINIQHPIKVGCSTRIYPPASELVDTKRLPKRNNNNCSYLVNNIANV